VEYTQPRSFLEGQGVQVTLLSPKDAGQQIQGFNHLEPGDKFTVDLNVKDAKPGDYDLLLLPGGVANPDTLRVRSPSSRPSATKTNRLRPSATARGR
jgi:protease I